MKRVQQEFPELTVLATEGEADGEPVCAFGRCLQTSYVRVRKDGPLEVAAILSGASLFIGNDSGIADLAAAVGVPTAAVFRASIPAVRAPRGEHVRVASDDSLPDIGERVARKVLSGRRYAGNRD